MKVTVVVCTYNRCDDLRMALTSLASSEVRESMEWEVLVVDNNSTDATSSVVQEFICRYPSRFRYVFEPTPGKSYALNRGIRECQGDILAFTDDDVIVEKEWLAKLTQSLCGSTYAGASGRTLSARDFTPPRWLPMNEYFAHAPLGLFDRGLDPIDLAEAPFGNNMAFRREVFERYGTFRVDIGPRPGTVLVSEDSEFGERLLAAGERLRYEPAAVLYHAVPAQRVTKKYFLAWWHDKTRSDVRAFGLPCSLRWKVAGIPLPLFRRLFRWSLQWLFTLDTAKRFSCKLRVWTVRGAIHECYWRAQGGTP
jgi:glycosyltransferase involved in cell wall biosynthesis